jgi:hypothetical protein
LTRSLTFCTHTHLLTQVSTTKGTGGDIIILEEAAYVDPGFFYETVAPLLIVGTTSLLAISTLTSEINFYSRLLRMRDKVTNQPLFSVLSVTLACAKCREDGKAADCAHMLHLVPRWQSGDRHVKLKTVMQDRPDLIESELSGLAFDSLQQVFRSVDMDIMFSQPPPSWITNDAIHLFIDPAAGGPGSDYAILSVGRQKGLITVSTIIRTRAPWSAHESFWVFHRGLHMAVKAVVMCPGFEKTAVSVDQMMPVSLHTGPATELDRLCNARHHHTPAPTLSFYILTASRHKVNVFEILIQVQQRDGLILDPRWHDRLTQLLVQSARLVRADGFEIRSDFTMTEPHPHSEVLIQQEEKPHA